MVDRHDVDSLLSSHTPSNFEVLLYWSGPTLTNWWHFIWFLMCVSSWLADLYRFLLYFVMHWWRLSSQSCAFSYVEEFVVRWQVHYYRPICTAKKKQKNIISPWNLKQSAAIWGGEKNVTWNVATEMAMSETKGEMKSVFFTSCWFRKRGFRNIISLAWIWQCVPLYVCATAMYLKVSSVIVNNIKRNNISFILDIAMCSTLCLCYRYVPKS